MSLATDTHRELVELVERLLLANEEAQPEADSLLEKFASLIPHPNAPDLIYWPESTGLPPTPTAEEIVTQALNHKPFAL